MMRRARAIRFLPWSGTAALFGLAVWPRIFAGLSTDESGSWWIVKEDFSSMAERAWSWSATSPLYYSLLWAWSRAVDGHEPAMRILPALLLLLTGWVLYRLALRWLDAEGAALSVLLFFASPVIASQVVSLRPYPLGLLLTAACWLSFYRWLDSGRLSGMMPFVFLAAAAIWSHYAFAFALLPLALPAAQMGWKRALAALGAAAVLLTPLALQVAQILSRRGELVTSQNPTISYFAEKGLHILFPLTAAAGLLLMIAAALNALPHRFPPGRRPALPLFLLAVLPVAGPWLAGIVSGTPVWVERYTLSMYLGVSILGAWFVRGMRPGVMRKTVTGLLIVAAVVAGSIRAAKPEHRDWRSLSEWIERQRDADNGLTVVLVSPFVESAIPEKLHDPEMGEVLRGPFARYLPARNEVLLPIRPDESAGRQMEVALQRARNAGCGVLFATGSATGRYLGWIEARMRAAGFSLVTEWRRGGLVARIYGVRNTSGRGLTRPWGAQDL